MLLLTTATQFPLTSWKPGAQVHPFLSALTTRLSLGEHFLQARPPSLKVKE
jgi:hypothetical protein